MFKVTIFEYYDGVKRYNQYYCTKRGLFDFHYDLNKNGQWYKNGIVIDPPHHLFKTTREAISILRQSVKVIKKEVKHYRVSFWCEEKVEEKK